MTEAGDFSLESLDPQWWRNLAGSNDPDTIEKYNRLLTEHNRIVDRANKYVMEKGLTGELGLREEEVQQILKQNEEIRARNAELYHISLSKEELEEFISLGGEYLLPEEDGDNF